MYLIIGISVEKAYLVNARIWIFGESGLRLAGVLADVGFMLSRAELWSSALKLRDRTKTWNLLQGEVY